MSLKRNGIAFNILAGFFTCFKMSPCPGGEHCTAIIAMHEICGDEANDIATSAWCWRCPSLTGMCHSVLRLPYITLFNVLESGKP